jgi:hypothetical protein
MAYILAVNPRILAGKEKLDALDGCLLSFWLTLLYVSAH